MAAVEVDKREIVEGVWTQIPLKYFEARDSVVLKLELLASDLNKAGVTCLIPGRHPETGFWSVHVMVRGDVEDAKNTAPLLKQPWLIVSQGTPAFRPLRAQIQNVSALSCKNYHS